MKIRMFNLRHCKLWVKWGKNNTEGILFSTSVALCYA